MIFHTVCDQLYFDRFYNDFYNSIKLNAPSAQFSLNLVDSRNSSIEQFCDENGILLTMENRSLDDLRNLFPTAAENDLLGYYPLCRWGSIPEIGENVCVCDVDIQAINPIDIAMIENLLTTYDVVNITRTKPNGETGGMMLICLSSRIVHLVNTFTIDHKRNITSIGIAEDVKVRTYIYTFNVCELNGKMLDVTKPKEKSNNEWFIFSKGGQGENSIRKKIKLDNFIGKTNGS